MWRYRSVAALPSEEAVLMTAMCAWAPPASWTKRDRMTRSPSLSSAPPITITGPTGPPSVVGASRNGVDASVIHDSVPAFQFGRCAVSYRNLYPHCHIFALLKVAAQTITDNMSA